mgnify:CR=1 FL=1
MAGCGVSGESRSSSGDSGRRRPAEKALEPAYSHRHRIDVPRTALECPAGNCILLHFPVREDYQASSMDDLLEGRPGTDADDGEVVTDPDQAVAEADVVSTATRSTVPLFSAEALRPGAHINAVGAFTPEMVEIPAGVVRQAFVVVDDLEAAASEAGDLLQAGRRPDTDLAGLLAKRVEPVDEPFTLFKSVGIAAQDAAAAIRALENAERLSIGTHL